MLRRSQSLFMKETLTELLKKSRHLEEPITKAEYLISLLEVIKFPVIDNHGFQSIDGTLRVFKENKERKYIIFLLKHFIENGNFDQPSGKTEMAFELDSFNSLKEMLVNEFIFENKADALGK